MMENQYILEFIINYKMDYQFDLKVEYSAWFIKDSLFKIDIVNP